MKTSTNFSIIAAALLFSGAAFSQVNSLKPVSIPDLPSNVSADWFSAASAEVKDLQDEFYPLTNDAFRVVNTDNRLGFTIRSNGYSIMPIRFREDQTPWKVDFSIVGIGRANDVISTVPAFVVVKKKKAIAFSANTTDIEYVNDRSGLRQNFIIKERPKGNGEVAIKMQWESNLSAKLLAGNQLVFFQHEDPKAIELIYEDLKVWDANNRPLPARMEINAITNTISLVVNDANAQYPITVDPLNKTPEWTSSADGVLPGLLTNLQLQVQTLYGYTVAGLGDINGDGYDDVAVSAPGMADVITTGSLASVGAVFIYLGSPAGLPTTPSKVLQPTTAVAGALFGFSIDAGDITGDGKNDIVIGAPMDSYQTTAQGLFGNVNVNVTAGKVYVYRSEDLFSAANPSPFLQLRLQGSDFFGTGVLGLLDNVSAKFLFGFSVAVTEDMNADNKADILIGSPNFIGADLLSVQSGAAFVYYSNNLSTIAPVQLSTPSPTLLGLPLLPLANTTGLLFGYSVDGLGDYNGDGRADVIVGAPAGVDLSSLGGIFSGQVLGGSAYIYYGGASSVSTSIGVRLQSTPSGLLSNAANLFGYKVKGIRSSTGIRNGNALVGAPVGSVLSNIVGGLRVKAGQVHVFVKKNSSPASPVSSDQALSSPRSSSILSILAGRTINVSLMFGASMDNMLDVNCDGIGDIIVGEPLSTTVPLIGADVVGGAAYVYLGQANGTFSTATHWDLTSVVSPILGINTTALLGFSVAGAKYVRGLTPGVRALVGGPSNSLDFGIGLLNLGNTLGTTFDFAFDNNGLGKSYTFSFPSCNIVLPLDLQSFEREIKEKTVLLTWTSTNEDNFSHYELERSKDGVVFSPIALVFGKDQTHNEYAYSDGSPFLGMNYYRLKMIDNDGQFKYSKILTARFSEISKGDIVIAPNPIINNQIRLQLSGLEAGSYRLELHNTAGQLLHARPITVSQYQQVETVSPDKQLVPGIYWVKVIGKNNNSLKTLRVLVSK
jgi:hypothetical protein